MAKKQKLAIPEIGDRVRSRGFETEGYLIWINERKWTWVWWDNCQDYTYFSKGSEKITHLFTLEKIEE